MKTTIKKVIIAMVCLVAFSAEAAADRDTPISVGQLPQAAQQVVSKHFADKKVAMAKVESGLISKSYDVVFADGAKLEFDRNGAWTEIDCGLEAVPAALVPSQISSYVNTTYSGAAINKIEKDDGQYEIKLSTGLEITFNKRFQVVDID